MRLNCHQQLFSLVKLVVFSFCGVVVVVWFFSFVFVNVIAEWIFYAFVVVLLNILFLGFWFCCRYLTTEMELQFFMIVLLWFYCFGRCCCCRTTTILILMHRLPSLCRCLMLLNNILFYFLKEDGCREGNCKMALTYFLFPFVIDLFSSSWFSSVFNYVFFVLLFFSFFFVAGQRCNPSYPQIQSVCHILRYLHSSLWNDMSLVLPVVASTSGTSCK